MEKLARKPSTDPVQERLRQNKANWNKEVSTFINDLIHLKKTMNGWPSKFHKERSRIVDPVPSDPNTIIGSLAGDFQEIVNKGNALVQEQLNYSKTRRRRRPKQLNLPLPPQPATPATPAAPAAPPKQDLSKQLELGFAADDSGGYYLISQASNPLSRFFARLLSPGLGSSEGARIRRYRMSLLNAALRMYKDMKALQSAVVGSGPQSIFLASKLLDKSEDNWVFLASGFKTFVDTLPGGATDTGTPIEVPPSLKEEPEKSPKAGPAPADAAILSSPQVVKALEAVQDIQAYSNNFKGVTGMPALREAAKKFYLAPSNEKSALADLLLGNYRAVLMQLSMQKKIPIATSLGEIVAASAKVTSASEAQDQLQTVAQAFLKKLRHQISPFDKTSSFRLDIYKMAVENKKLLDKMMDHLESGLDEKVLSGLMREIGSNMLRMKTLMQGLTSTIKGMGYQPEFINLLERGRIGDYGVDLTPKQKAELGKLLQQKQMRELTKMYGR